MNDNIVILPELGKTNNPFLCINTQVIFKNEKPLTDEVQDALDILYPKSNVRLNNFQKWKAICRQFH